MTSNEKKEEPKSGDDDGPMVVFYMELKIDGIKKFGINNDYKGDEVA